MESIMLPQNQTQTQTEDTRRIGEHPPPIIGVEVRERSRSRKHGVILAIVLLVVAALLMWGIWSRASASTALRGETSQAALPAVSVVSPKQTAPPQDITTQGTLNPLIPSPTLPPPTGPLRNSSLTTT